MHFTKYCPFKYKRLCRELWFGVVGEDDAEDPGYCENDGLMMINAQNLGSTGEQWG